MQCTQIWTPPWGSMGVEGSLSFYVGVKGRQVRQWTQISHRKLKNSISYSMVIWVQEPDAMLKKKKKRLSLFNQDCLSSRLFQFADECNVPSNFIILCWQKLGSCSIASKQSFPMFNCENMRKMLSTGKSSFFSSVSATSFSQQKRSQDFMDQIGLDLPTFLMTLKIPDHK